MPEERSFVLRELWQNLQASFLLLLKLIGGEQLHQTGKVVRLRGRIGRHHYRACWLVAVANDEHCT